MIKLVSNIDHIIQIHSEGGNNKCISLFLENQCGMKWGFVVLFEDHTIAMTHISAIIQ